MTASLNDEATSQAFAKPICICAACNPWFAHEITATVHLFLTLRLIQSESLRSLLNMEEPTASTISPPQASADHPSTSTERDVRYSYTRAHPGMEEWLKPNLKDLTYLNVSVGQRFKQGRYVIVRKLGWGSFGTVWLARDRK
jgi:hypothetical protein